MWAVEAKRNIPIGIETYLNGHKIIWNDIDKKWYYLDGSSTEIFRPCPKCGKLPDKNGHDACIGKLPGVKMPVVVMVCMMVICNLKMELL